MRTTATAPRWLPACSATNKLTPTTATAMAVVRSSAKPATSAIWKPRLAAMTWLITSRYPMSSNISKRRAVQILTRAGYNLEAVKKHERWTNGQHTIALPISPSSDLYGFMAHQIKQIAAGVAPSKARRNL